MPAEGRTLDPQQGARYCVECRVGIARHRKGEFAPPLQSIEAPEQQQRRDHHAYAGNDPQWLPEMSHRAHTGIRRRKVS